MQRTHVIGSRKLFWLQSFRTEKGAGEPDDRPHRKGRRFSSSNVYRVNSPLCVSDEGPLSNWLLIRKAGSCQRRTNFRLLMLANPVYPLITAAWLMLMLAAHLDSVCVVGAVGLGVRGRAS